MQSTFMGLHDFMNVIGYYYIEFTCILGVGFLPQNRKIITFDLEREKSLYSPLRIQRRDNEDD